MTNSPEPPGAHDGAHESEEPESEELESGEPQHYFFFASTPKVAVFLLLGSWWYVYYWSYRSWRAYRRDWGYSRRGFWQRTHAQTGYRPSALWRTLLSGAYFFCLFPAVDRECRRRRLPGLAAPIGIALLFSVISVVSNALAGSHWYFLCSPIVALLPVQMAVARLNPTIERKDWFDTSAGEVLVVLFGFLVNLTLGAG